MTAGQGRHDEFGPRRWVAEPLSMAEDVLVHARTRGVAAR